MVCALLFVVGLNSSLWAREKKLEMLRYGGASATVAEYRLF